MLVIRRGRGYGHGRGITFAFSVLSVQCPTSMLLCFKGPPRRQVYTPLVLTADMDMNERIRQLAALAASADAVTSTKAVSKEEVPTGVPTACECGLEEDDDAPAAVELDDPAAGADADASRPVRGRRGRRGRRRGRRVAARRCPARPVGDDWQQSDNESTAASESDRIAESDGESEADPRLESSDGSGRGRGRGRGRRAGAAVAPRGRGRQKRRLPLGSSRAQHPARRRRVNGAPWICEACQHDNDKGQDICELCNWPELPEGWISPTVPTRNSEISGDLQ
eukprot:g2174.t1